MTLPPAVTAEKRYVVKYDHIDYFGKLLGKGDNDCQAPERTNFGSNDAGPGLGLDAMATAVSLRCVQPAIIAPVGLRSPLDVLLDAATCR